MKCSLLIFVTCILLDLRSVKGLINGIRARIGELPYMVGIMQDGTIICGGALISDRHVLTNAHCVTDRSVAGLATYTDLEVCVGTVNRDDFSTGEIIQIDKISPHPDFEQTIDSMANYDDIAVITLKSPITVSESVKPIGLPEPMQNYPPNTQFTVGGFGVMNDKGSLSMYLRSLSTRSVSQQDCQATRMNRRISPSHLCAQPGVCVGDLGGPLTIDGKVIVGIASEIYNDRCGSNLPDIYTKVSHYIDFIRREMGQLPPGTSDSTNQLFTSLNTFLTKAINSPKS